VGFEPHRHFDHWTRLYDLLPAGLILRCADMGADSAVPRVVERYVRETGDADVACHRGDTVWFSPACRNRTDACVPLMVQYTFDYAMQMAFWLRFPLAIVLVGPGAAGDYAEYYAAARRGRMLFGWYQPDDSLVDAAGRLPVLVNMPTTNDLEYVRGLYRTGTAQYKPRSYAWRGLQEADRLVHSFAARFTLFGPDVDALMLASRRLKDARAAGAPGAPADDLATARRAACEWVRATPERWRPWIPAICAGGTYADQTLSACLPCPAGSYCAGGVAGPQACLPGDYCPAGAAGPTACPDGRSGAGGAAAAAECHDCAPGRQAIAGACVPNAALIPALAAAAAALAAAAAAAVYRRKAARLAEAGAAEDDDARRLRLEARPRPRPRTLCSLHARTQPPSTCS
jgi:hypothetical protein